MEGITLEDVILMVKYDIDSGHENPERHIEKYVNRMCKEQHRNTRHQAAELAVKDTKLHSDIMNLKQITPTS